MITDTAAMLAAQFTLVRVGRASPATLKPNGLTVTPLELLNVMLLILAVLFSLSLQGAYVAASFLCILYIVSVGLQECVGGGSGVRGVSGLCRIRRDPGRLG